MQLETLFVKRFDQMSPDEMTCAACGFSISGFGSPFFFKYVEQSVMESISTFSSTNIQELCRAFIYS